MTPSIEAREMAAKAYELYAELYMASLHAFCDAVAFGDFSAELEALQKAMADAWETFASLGVDLIKPEGNKARRCAKTGIPIVSTDELDDGDDLVIKQVVAA